MKLYICPTTPRALKYYSNLKIFRTHKDDAGFDLIIFDNEYVFGQTKKVIDFEIRCYMKEESEQQFRSYMLCSRSSICKTPLILQNGIGIIDAGYRGNILGCFFNLSSETYEIKQDTKLAQIVAPDLKSFDVEIISDMNDYIECTSDRGSGGFGSTGK